MKRPLLLAIFSLFIANAALADHIGIYSDDTGSSCNLTGTGVTETTAILHKFATGTVASRFKLDHSAASGIIIVSFLTSYTPIGSLDSDMTVAYGSCKAGSFVAGHVSILWLSSPSGTLSIVKASGFASVLWFDCANGEHPATGGHASINGSASTCGEPTPVEPSTWGSVKALYR